MSQLRSNLASFSQDFRRKRRELVAVLFVTCKRKHFGAQAHELDIVLVVPANHFDNVACIGQAQALHVLLPERYICLLGLVRSILGWVLWLRWVCQGMSVFNDGRDTQSSGTEHGRLGGPQIGIETGLIQL